MIIVIIIIAMIILLIIYNAIQLHCPVSMQLHKRMFCDAGGRLQPKTHMHPTHVASNKVTLKNGPRMYGVHRACAETGSSFHAGTSLVTTKERCKYTIWVDIQGALCVKLLSHSQSRVPPRA